MIESCLDKHGQLRRKKCNRNKKYSDEVVIIVAVNIIIIGIVLCVTLYCLFCHKPTKLISPQVQLPQPPPLMEGSYFIVNLPQPPPMAEPGMNMGSPMISPKIPEQPLQPSMPMPAPQLQYGSPPVLQ